MNFPIGELSKRTGTKVPTIRYYESIGLLPEPLRTEGNQRRYDRGHLDRLSFIRHARSLGFEVSDIRELLAMAERPQDSCHQADSIARSHLVKVERRIEQLETLRHELQRMVNEFDHGRICDCRIIEVLADHEQCETEHSYPAHFEAVGSSK
jgi:DNA-binding transcriptional MerR regulator